MNDTGFNRILTSYRTMRRAATAKNALDVTAVILLLASLIFWATAFWQLFAPRSIVGVLQVGVLAIVMAVVAPVLWSALVPTTPAGQLLQKSQARTIGFAMITGAAVYLSYVALNIIQSWLASQLSASAPDALSLGYPLSIALVIGFILVPALAWTQVAPERWLQQIEQAHQVKKLEALQAGELAIIKTRLLWAKQKAAASYANLLPLEQREVLDTMRGLFLSIGDTQRAIAGTLRDSVDFDREFAPIKDEQVYAALDYVADTLEAKRIDVPQYAEPDADVVTVAPRDVPAPPRPGPAPAPPRGSPGRPAGARRATPRYAAELESARRIFGREMFTPAQLGKEVGEKSERTARDWLKAWEEAGCVARGETAGGWYLTESEAT